MIINSLYGLTPKEIAEKLNLSKKFQGTQIFEWLNRGVISFEEMSNLSKELRNSLIEDEEIKIVSSKVIDKQEDESGAIKIALELIDGKVIETVLLKDKEGQQTACLSSQVGCAMGCKFCRTGTMRLERNLESFEIIEQFFHLVNLYGKIDHIVFMGMGEPLANVDSVVLALQYFHNPKGLNMSYRRITISTSGLVPGLKKLQACGLPVKLAVSIVSADETIRSSLMPINRKYDLRQLKAAIIEWQHEFKRRVTFECCLISGINTSEMDARKLYFFCTNIDVMLNLIPFNEAAELDYQTPSEDEIDDFCSYLDRYGLSYTRRFSRGRNVNGACGQLAVKQNR